MTVTPERWQQIKQAFEAARQQAGDEQRHFLDDLRAQDPSLHHDVTSLLAHEREAGLLQSPLVVPRLDDAAPALEIGTRIGSYEVTGLLGAGGMGEVYRARDSKLGRDVAVKVLPPLYLDDAERLSRLEREARLLASLNHPNIAAIYGLEESAGMPALILELVEGRTLAELIAARQSPGRPAGLPQSETLSIARQIAAALEAAHDAGIVHRDLKPANVKVTAVGHVKVLDFGLATLLDSAPGRPAEATTRGQEVDTGALSGGRGSLVIKGTPGYMSPEQARGAAVDRRTDIWAFGVVLYEMLTGRRPFDGDDVPEVLAKVLQGDPALEALPAATPLPIRRLLRRCLQKRAGDRLHHIADATLEIRDALAPPPDEPAPDPRRPQPPWRRPALLAVGGLLAGALLAGLGLSSLGSRPESPRRPVVRLPIELPSTQRLTGFAHHAIALSPDDAWLAYGANDRLYLRAMSELEARPVPDSEGAVEPFFSPDGEWLAFWQAGRLRKVQTRGGEPVALCSAARPTGASWAADGTILFGQGAAGIMAVSALGGEPTVVVPMRAELGEQVHGPVALPGGREVLFTRRSGTAEWVDAEIVVHSLDTGDQRVIVSRGTDARYLESGHLLFARDSTLLAAPVDPGDWRLVGTPVPVADRLMWHIGSGAAQFTASAAGSLVYMLSVNSAVLRPFWFDRQGRHEPVAMEPGAYSYPRLSPDGTRMAISTAGPGNRDVWIYDFARQAMTRLTFGQEIDIGALWAADGDRVVYSSRREHGGLFWKRSDGSGRDEQLLASANEVRPYAWSADGRQLLYIEQYPATDWDILALPMTGNRTPVPLLQTAADERRPVISPDGRWMAYQSDESGRFEVYVRPFPDVEGGRWQVSTEGGTSPLWEPGGLELFYREADRLMRVAVDTAAGFTVGAPATLLTGLSTRDADPVYDVAADGQRFLVLVDDTSAAPPLVLVQHWMEEVEGPAPPVP